MFCPNIKNKEVVKGFNEIVEALGGKPLTEEEFKSSELRNQRTGLDYSAMEATYKVYHRNNGNLLDKTPEGKDSILFKSLVDYYNGDKTKAIEAKSRVYSDGFINWFGDWINNPTNASKVVDENGEPLMVYHGSKDNTFSIFDRSKNDKGKKGFFFTNSIVMASSYGKNPRGFFLNAKDPYIIQGKGKNWNDINLTTSDIAKDKLDAIRLHRNNLYIDLKQGKISQDDYNFWNDKYYSYLDQYNNLDNSIINKIKKYFIKQRLNTFNANGDFINSTRKTESILELDSDDVQIIFKDIVDYGPVFNLKAATQLLSRESSNVYVVTTPNQIKSATDNNGEFSLENDDVYNTIVDTKNDPNIINAYIYSKKLTDNVLNSEYKNWDDKKRESFRKEEKQKFKNNYPRLNLLFYYNKDNKTYNSYVRTDSELAVNSYIRSLGNIEKEKAVRLNNEQLASLFEHLYKDVRGISEHSKIIVDILKAAIKNSSISIKFTENLPNNIGARYTHFDKTISINTNVFFRNESRFNTNLTQTLLHELLHAATVQTIQHSEELKNELQSLLNTVKKQIGTSTNIYGLTDIYEFLAELSNEQFVEQLKQVQVKNKSIFNSIYNFLAKVISKMLPKQLSKYNGTAYTQAMDLLLKSTLPEKFNITLQDKRNDFQDSFNIAQEYIEKRQIIANKLRNTYNLLYKEYERIPNKSPQRQRIQNELYTKASELKRMNDLEAMYEVLQDVCIRLGVPLAEGEQPEKNSIINYLENQRRLDIPFKNVDSHQIVMMKKHHIDVFKHIVDDLIPNIEDLEYFIDKDETILGNNVLQQFNYWIRGIKDSINQATGLWQEALYIVGDREIDELTSSKNLVGVTSEDRKNMNEVLKDNLHRDMFYGDVNKIVSYIHNAQYSTSPIIKAIFHKIQQAEQKRLDEVQPIAEHLTRLYNDADRTPGRFFKTGWQKIYQEMDDNGLPTGYFAREVKYGLYKRDLEEFTKELNEKFDKQYGHYYLYSDGVYVNSATEELAEDEQWGPNGEMPTFIKYQLELEKFKSQRANRRYTFDYYKERLSRPYTGTTDPNEITDGDFNHGLSPKTLSEYNYRQRIINYYLNLCTGSVYDNEKQMYVKVDNPSGMAHPERLSEIDKRKLDEVEAELRDLSNPFNIDGTNKTGDQLQMAFEIRAWEKWIGDRTDSIYDYDSFNEEMNKIIKESQETNNPKLINDFLRYNAIEGLNPVLLDLVFGDKTFEYIDDARIIRSQILKSSMSQIVKLPDGRHGKDFNTVLKNPNFFLDARNIEQTLADVLSEKSSSKNKTGVEINDYVSWEEAPYINERGFYVDVFGDEVSPYLSKNHMLKSWKEYIIDHYVDYIMNSEDRSLYNLHDANGENIHFLGTKEDVRKQVNKLFTITKTINTKEGPKQVEQSLDLFKILIPKSDTFIDPETGETLPSYTRIPKRGYAKKSNYFINSDYDITNSEIEQPKSEFFEGNSNTGNGNRRYDNSEQYNKIQKDKKLKNLYDALIDTMKYSKNQYSTNPNFDYRLPQITASTSQLYSRILSQQGLNAIGQIFRSFFTVEDNDSDLRQSTSFREGPDGQSIVDVPLRYLEDLKNPSLITSDVVSSVIMYLDMAVNFKVKQDIDDDIRTIRYNLDTDNREVQTKKNLGYLSRTDIESPIDSKWTRSQFDTMTNSSMYGNQARGSQNHVAIDKLESIAKTNKLTTALSPAIGFGTLGSVYGSILGAVGLVFPSMTSGLITGGVAGFIIGGLIGGLSYYGNSKYKGQSSSYKITRNLQKLGALHMLGLNIASQATGFFDAMSRQIIQGLAGRYMTIGNLASSIIEYITYLPLIIKNWGNPVPNNKLSRVMQKHGISKDIIAAYGKVGKGRLRKIGSQLLMGGFSMGDWAANSILTMSFYKNVRFYSGNKIDKGFYTKYEMYIKFKEAGYSKNQARLAYLFSNNLWDCINSNGDLKDKKYEPYMRNFLKSDIRSKVLSRSALYNGMNPDNDTPAWKQDPLGTTIGAMRNFIIQNYQNSVQWRPDNIVPQYIKSKVNNVSGNKTTQKEVISKLPLTPEQIYKRMSWNWETGTPQEERLSGTYRLLGTLRYKIQNVFNSAKRNKRKFSDVELYSIKEFLIHGLMAWSLLYCYSASMEKTADIISNMPKSIESQIPITSNPKRQLDFAKDFIENDYFMLQKQYVNIRVAESVASSLVPFSATDFITSPTVYTSVWDDFSGLTEFMLEAFGIDNSKSPDDEIKQGGYKYYNRAERTLFKSIGPLKNIHSFISPWHIKSNTEFYLKRSEWASKFAVGIPNLYVTNKNIEKEQELDNVKESLVKDNIIKEDFVKDEIVKDEYIKE